MVNREEVELFVLISLIDYGGQASWLDAIENIYRKAYLPDFIKPSQTSTLKIVLEQYKYIQLEPKSVRITSDGINRAVFLSKTVDLNKVAQQGQIRISEFTAQVDKWSGEKRGRPLPDRRKPQIQSITKTTKVKKKKRKPPAQPKPVKPSKKTKRRKNRKKSAKTAHSKILKKAKKGPKTGHFHVYVVELDPEIMMLRKPRFAGKPNKPCVYVGQTGLTPKERFKNHKRGYKASRHVRDYGLKLLPKLYKKYNPLNDWPQSIEVESALAKELHSLGYTVYGGR